MTKKEHYASLGANYNTIRSICCRKGFEATEIAYEYWKSQQEKKEKFCFEFCLLGLVFHKDK